jgi:hypothetical protein
MFLSQLLEDLGYRFPGFAVMIAHRHKPSRSTARQAPPFRDIVLKHLSLFNPPRRLRLRSRAQEDAKQD